MSRVEVRAEESVTLEEFLAVNRLRIVVQDEGRDFRAVLLPEEDGLTAAWERVAVDDFYLRPVDAYGATGERALQRLVDSLSGERVIVGRWRRRPWPASWLVGDRFEASRTVAVGRIRQ